MKKSKKIAQVGDDCVACGCCAGVCPNNAISIAFGIVARVDREVCIGCGKCARECPAAIISIVAREELK